MTDRVAHVLIRSHSLWVAMSVLGLGETDHSLVQRLLKREVHQPLLTKEKLAPNPTEDRRYLPTNWRLKSL
jgi:hypothetical protein